MLHKKDDPKSNQLLNPRHHHVEDDQMIEIVTLRRRGLCTSSSHGSNHRLKHLNFFLLSIPSLVKILLCFHLLRLWYWGEARSNAQRHFSFTLDNAFDCFSMPSSNPEIISTIYLSSICGVLTKERLNHLEHYWQMIVRKIGGFCIEKQPRITTKNFVALIGI